MISRSVKYCLLISLMLAVSFPAFAVPVDVPVRIHGSMLQRIVNDFLDYRSREKIRIWDDRSGCNFLELFRPAVSFQGKRVRIYSKGIGRIGTRVGDQCLFSKNWQGFVEVLQQPVLSQNGRRVRFRITDSNIYDSQGRSNLAESFIWDLIKIHLHPKLSTLSIDLGSALDELRALLPLFIQDKSGHSAALLRAIRFSQVSVQDPYLEARLRMEVPVSSTATTQAEPVLTREEYLLWTRTWKSWDSFITSVVKMAAASTEQKNLRLELRDVLLNTRHELSEILTKDRIGSNAMVRDLFLSTWSELSPILLKLNQDLGGSKSLQLLSFIAAADALKAIDRLGAGFGIEISTNGLRRLARIIIPETVKDPLRYEQQVDPELRELFDFGPPIEAPVFENDQRSLLDLLIGPARASYNSERLLAARLNRWVPEGKNVKTYVGLVRKLLLLTVRKTLRHKHLPAEFRHLFQPMVLATAWQESCWRQYDRVRGKIKPVTSSAGAVGIMQVNPAVWRGFYQVRGLKMDISYNARAGAEILMHYLTEWAIAKKEHKVTGNVENLARAAYSAYNAGPQHLKRYRRTRIPRSWKRIDKSFWRKYQLVKAGRELEVRYCYGVR